MPTQAMLKNRRGLDRMTDDELMDHADGLWWTAYSWKRTHSYLHGWLCPRNVTEADDALGNARSELRRRSLPDI